MQESLFDPAWWMPLAGLIVGAAVFLSGNTRQQNAVRSAGVIVALLSVGWFVTAWFVDTPLEICTRQTRAFAADVQNRAWPQLSALLDPQVSLGVPSHEVYANQSELLHGVQSGVQNYGLKAVHVLSLTPFPHGAIITIDMTVWTEQDSALAPSLTSSWELQWAHEGSGWLLQQITCTRIGDQSVNQLGGNFPR